MLMCQRISSLILYNNTIVYLMDCCLRSQHKREYCRHCLNNPPLLPFTDARLRPFDLKESGPSFLFSPSGPIT